MERLKFFNYDGNPETTADTGATRPAKRKGGSGAMLTPSEREAALREEDSKKIKKKRGFVDIDIDEAGEADEAAESSDFAMFTTPTDPDRASERASEDSARWAEDLEEKISQVLSETTTSNRSMTDLGRGLDYVIKKLDDLYEKITPLLNQSAPQPQRRMENSQKDPLQVVRENISAQKKIREARPVVSGFWFGKKFYQTREDADAASVQLTGEKASNVSLTAGYAFVTLANPGAPYSALKDKVGAIAGATPASEEEYRNYLAKCDLASYDSSVRPVVAAASPAQLQGKGRGDAASSPDVETGNGSGTA